VDIRLARAVSDSQAFNEKEDCEQLLEGLWADGLVGLGDVIEGPVIFSWRKLPRGVELLCVTEYLRGQVFGFLSAHKDWRAGADKEHP
jgi:hypothetical protein